MTQQAQEKVCKEVAEETFRQWAKAMDIKTDLDKYPGAESIFTAAKEYVIDAIMSGVMILNESDELVYTCRRTTTKEGEAIVLTFTEWIGAALAAQDTSSEQQLYRKMHATLGSICGVPPATFAKMKKLDHKTCQAVYFLLMA